MYIGLVHRDDLSVEANVRRAQNGDLVLLCTCGGGSEPAPGNRTYLFRSEDDGKTWSEGMKLGEEDGLARYHTETAVLGDKLKVFVSSHNGRFVNWRNEVYESADSGRTWSVRPLRELPSYAFVRSMLRLSDGKILFPYHFYPVTQEMESGCLERGDYVWKSPIKYVESGFLLSGDGGETFERRVAFRTTAEEMKELGLTWFWPENTVTETEKGHLVMLFRVDRSGFLWRSDSFDGGNAWSRPFVSDIPNPSNKPQLLKTEDGRVVLLNTPRGGYGLEARFPLEIWISEDGMRTWKKKIRLSDFPGAYSYANGFIEGNVLYLAFEFNRHDVYFARVDLDEDI